MGEHGYEIEFDEESSTVRLPKCYQLLQDGLSWRTMGPQMRSRCGLRVLIVIWLIAVLQSLADMPEMTAFFNNYIEICLYIILRVQLQRSSRTVILAVGRVCSMSWAMREVPEEIGT